MTISRLLLGLILLCILSPLALADLPADPFPRPVCTKLSDFTFGLCFNSDIHTAIQVMQSPAYRARVAAVAAEALRYLDTQTPDPKSVVLTDLDETLINNIPYYQRYGHYNPGTFRAWIGAHPNGPYQQPVADLLKHARERGFTVIFLTGRGAIDTSTTLRQASLLRWDGVYLKPLGVPLTATVYKHDVRMMLHEMGFNLVLNIGDQRSDLEHPDETGHGEFLLPNTLYTIP